MGISGGIILSLPFLANILIISTFPFLAAWKSAVSPLNSCAFTSIPGVSTKALTALVLLAHAAITINGQSDEAPVPVAFGLAPA